MMTSSLLFVKKSYFLTISLFCSSMSFHHFEKKLISAQIIFLLINRTFVSVSQLTTLQSSSEVKRKKRVRATCCPRSVSPPCC